MTVYEYRCDDDGMLEVTRPLGTAPPSITCPTCGRVARRVFSPPMTTSLPPDLVGAIDHAEKTRDEPDVVTSLPPKSPRHRTPVAPLTPARKRLPRP